MTTLASPDRTTRTHGAERTARHAVASFWSHSWLLTIRSLRTLARQPMYLAFNLVQPMVWLLLFGQLFTRVAELPGFGSTSYLEYLTPGVVVMTAVFSAGWAGTSFIQDMDRGVMDRNLTSPVSRGAMIAGSLAYQAVTTIIQSLIVFGVGYLAGARYAGGWVRHHRGTGLRHPDGTHVRGVLRARHRELDGMGFKVCLWMNPYIYHLSPVFPQAAEDGYFLKQAGRRGLRGRRAGTAPTPPAASSTSPTPPPWNGSRDLLRPLLRQGVRSSRPTSPRACRTTRWRSTA